MFRCDWCKKVSLPKQPSHLVIMSMRPKKYPFRPKAFLSWVRDRMKLIDDKGGEGWEIDWEDRVCASCKEAYDAEGVAGKIEIAWPSATEERPSNEAG